MNNPFDATTFGLCPYCQISGRASSRIRDEPAKCIKNRHGTCFGCQKLLDVERKIEEARRTLNNLLDEREALASTLNEYHDPISNRLPIEIASHMFLQCRAIGPEAHISPEQYDEESLITSVFAVSHVCQSWRKIARGTSRLWSTICATLTQSNCLSSLAFVCEWLKLSGELPLFIQLAVEDNPDQYLSSFARKVIFSLVQHCHRWKLLDLRVPHHLLPWISNLLLNQSLDRLEHLKLDVAGDNGDDPADFILSIQASPSLLTVRNMWLNQVSVNRDRLTHFFAPDFVLSGDESAQILSSAACLSFCHFSGVDGVPSPETSVHSSSLKILIIGYFPGEWWNSFTFPCLEVLDIQRPVATGSASWVHLQALLRRSGCKLLELVINDNSESQLEVKDVIKLTPDLQRLLVRGALLKEPFFHLLDEASTSASATQTTSGFLNNLTFLRLITEDGTFSWTWVVVFLNTMISRPERSLRFFEFQYLEKLSDDKKTYNGTLMDKDIFKLVKETLKDVESAVMDDDDCDLMDSLRGYHEL